MRQALNRIYRLSLSHREIELARMPLSINLQVEEPTASDTTPLRIPSIIGLSKEILSLRKLWIIIRIAFSPAKVFKTAKKYLAFV